MRQVLSWAKATLNEVNTLYRRFIVYSLAILVRDLFQYPTGFVHVGEAKGPDERQHPDNSGQCKAVLGGMILVISYAQPYTNCEK
jgi:hypothetical protein